MAMSVREALARVVDLFGPQANWNPNQLYGNLMVSPNGNILIGTTTDNGVQKLQINGTTLLGGSGLVFPDNSTQYSAAMGRNRAINGAALFAQLGTSVSVTTATNTYGGVDRFCANNVGAVGAFTQSQGTITWNGVAIPAVVQTVTTAVSSFTSAQYWGGVTQIFEGMSVYDFVNSPFVISFLFNSNITGTFSVEVRDSGGAHSYTTTFTNTANTPQYVVIPIPAYSSLAIAAGNGVGLYLNIGAIGGTGLQATALNAWQNNGPVTASTSSNWAATVGNFIAVTNLQVEAGEVATPFERRLPAFELMLIQRFVENFQVGQIACGGTNGATIAYLQMHYQPKRVTPSSISATAASTFAIWTGATGNITPSAITWTPQSQTSALVTATIAGATSGQAAILENSSGANVNVLAEF
jgi:hypothetical protein